MKKAVSEAVSAHQQQIREQFDDIQAGQHLITRQNTTGLNPRLLDLVNQFRGMIHESHCSLSRNSCSAQAIHIRNP